LREDADFLGKKKRSKDMRARRFRPALSDCREPCAYPGNGASSAGLFPDRQRQHAGNSLARCARGTHSFQIGYSSSAGCFANRTDVRGDDLHLGLKTIGRRHFLLNVLGHEGSSRPWAFHLHSICRGSRRCAGRLLGRSEFVQKSPILLLQ
jgi:hypothetical protein